VHFERNTEEKCGTPIPQPRLERETFEHNPLYHGVGLKVFNRYETSPPYKDKRRLKEDI
jgi:hypothetical protein